MSESEATIKPDMHEFHTGHLPKPQYSTITKQLDTLRQPQTAQLQTTDQLAPRKQLAQLYYVPPPVTHYSLHYSRTQHYKNDLNNMKEFEDDDYWKF